ncbi:hypothetical protein PGB90_007560 [Kerria lacca]
MYGVKCEMVDYNVTYHKDGEILRWNKNGEVFGHVGEGVRLFLKRLDDGKEKAAIRCKVHISLCSYCWKYSTHQSKSCIMNSIREFNYIFKAEEYMTKP